MNTIEHKKTYIRAMEKYTFIDLFAGCGGLSEGFLMSGAFEGLAHVEWEKPMVQVLRNRLVKKHKHSIKEAERRVIHFDIQKTKELIGGDWTQSTKELFEKTNDERTMVHGLNGLIGNKAVDLIIGGPPCQAYSIAGRAQDATSMKNDYRNFLFESFAKIVDHYKPKVFVFENVGGMLSARPGDQLVTERVFKSFSKIGYSIRTPENLKKSVYNAAHFGVAQARRRVIIIGVRNTTRNRDDLAAIHKLETIYNAIDQSIDARSKPSVRSAIGDLPSFTPVLGKKTYYRRQSQKDLTIAFHKPRFHSKRDIRIFKEWLEKDMNKKSMEDKLAFYNSRFDKASNHVKYRNLEWDKPSPTIVAHLYKDGLMFIHPDKNQGRSITVKEAALLQSFPDDFEFDHTSDTNSFKMIGNAVPPLMAKTIAEAISKTIDL